MLQNFALTDPRVVENLTIADFALLPYYSFLSILAKANNYALKIQIAHFKVMRPPPPPQDDVVGQIRMGLLLIVSRGLLPSLLMKKMAQPNLFILVVILVALGL